MVWYAPATPWNEPTSRTLAPPADPAAAGTPGLIDTSTTAATMDRSADRTSTSPGLRARPGGRASGPSADGSYPAPQGPNLHACAARRGGEQRAGWLPKRSIH